VSGTLNGSHGLPLSLPAGTTDGFRVAAGMAAMQ